MTVQRTETKVQRRNRLAAVIATTLIAGSVAASTGCSSTTGGSRLAALNPFSKSETPAPATADQPAVHESVVQNSKNPITKSRDTLVSWFSKKGDAEIGGKKLAEDDPTSLASEVTVSPEVFVANGRLWESTGNFDKAMESYAKALEQRPNDPAALANIARLHFRQNNHKQAAEYFGKAIEQKPEDAGLYNDLGLTLSKLGNHPAAVATLTRALDLSPKSSRYANNLASVKFEANDAKGAFEVLAKNNTPAVAHFNIAYLHYKHQQMAEATSHLNQALSYKSQAGDDAAIKRAIERSSQLLAQIGGSSTVQPGAAIVQTAPASTAPSAATKPEARIATTPPATEPTATPTAGQSFQMGSNVPKYENAVTPASTGQTDVSFGSASYKTPAGTMGVNQTSAVAAPATPPSGSTPTATPAPTSKGFVFPTEIK